MPDELIYFVSDLVALAAWVCVAVGVVGSLAALIFLGD